MKEKCCIVCRMILGAVMGVMLVIVPCFVIILLVDFCWHQIQTRLRACSAGRLAPWLRCISSAAPR